MNRCAGIRSHRALHLNTELHYELHSYPKSGENRTSMCIGETRDRVRHSELEERDEEVDVQVDDRGDDRADEPEDSDVEAHEEARDELEDEHDDCADGGANRSEEGEQRAVDGLAGDRDDDAKREEDGLFILRQASCKPRSVMAILTTTM